MKTLSRWAKNNPWSARLIIVISHVLVLLNAILLGLLLFVFEWEIAKWVLVFIANIFFVLYVFYPKKSTKNADWGYSYARQKIHDFGLVLTYAAVLSLWVSNFCAKPDDHHNTAPPAATAKFMVLKPVIPEANADPGSWYANAKESIRSSRKELKRELRALKKDFKRSNNSEQGDGIKVLLILLTVLGALLLATLIAALACSIACSGNEGLALVVLILGFGGIIWLGVIVIKSILEKAPAGRNKV
jgi:hypothetical protein